MKTVAVEDLITSTIIVFLNSLEELGCKEHPVEWFKKLSDEEKLGVGEKLLNIIEREEPNE